MSLYRQPVTTHWQAHLADQHAGMALADGLFLDDPVEGFGLSAEDSAVLHSLMDIEFLG